MKAQIKGMKLVLDSPFVEIYGYWQSLLLGPLGALDVWDHNKLFRNVQIK